LFRNSDVRARVSTREDFKARYPRAQLQDRQAKRQRSVSVPDNSTRDAIPFPAVSPARHQSE
ncbi:MAG TPA: hypothetical protein PKW42_02975, partial [bacterium]|nr:hypothetical protein [bacterium]